MPSLRQAANCFVRLPYTEKRLKIISLPMVKAAVSAGSVSTPREKNIVPKVSRLSTTVT